MLPGPFQAEILHITSPACISVRLCTMKDMFCEMQQSLANSYCSNNHLQYRLQTGEFPQPGQSYAVRMPAAWYRGVVTSVNKNMDMFTVRLVDAGRIVLVYASALFKLAPQFLSMNAYSFLVHLSQMSQYVVGKKEEVVKHMEELLRDQEVVKIHRRASPKMVDGQWSLPVEISWTEMEDVDPFLPSIERQVFLSQRLLSSNNNSTVSLEETFEEEEEDRCAAPVVNNLRPVEINSLDAKDLDARRDSFPEPVACSSVKMKDVDNNKKPSDSTIDYDFKWLNPELPVKRHFYARATFVDDSGQIYLHLYEQRQQFRALRSNLNTHFQHSSPDCAMDSFTPSQEVVAKYVDEVWYRARFLGYVPDTECEKSYVLFVDWGNTSTVDTKLIRSNIIEQDKPIFAFRAVLHNVLPDRLDWDPDTIDFMMNKVLYTNNNNNIKVKVESGLDTQPLLVSIELFSPLDAGDARKEVFKPWIDMAEVLVQKKEARYVEQVEVNSPEQWRSRKQYDYGIGFTTMKTKKRKERNKVEKAVRESSMHERIPRLDLSCLKFTPGTIIRCRLAAVDSWDKVYIHLLSEGKGGMVDIYSSFPTLDRCMQARCRDMPPVITPREGLTVALWRGKSEGGWCRAEIVRCEETGFLVSVVDWGLQQWVSDSRKFRELPEECLGVAAQAVPLQLPLEALEEWDTLLALLTECLLSAEDMEMVVRIISCEGELFGHLLDKENNQPLYKRLEREKLLRLL